MIPCIVAIVGAFAAGLTLGVILGKWQEAKYQENYFGEIGKKIKPYCD